MSFTDCRQAGEQSVAQPRAVSLWRRWQTGAAPLQVAPPPSHNLHDQSASPKDGRPAAAGGQQEGRPPSPAAGPCNSSSGLTFMPGAPRRRNSVILPRSCCLGHCQRGCVAQGRRPVAPTASQAATENPDSRWGVAAAALGQRSSKTDGIGRASTAWVARSSEGLLIGEQRL